MKNKQKAMGSVPCALAMLVLLVQSPAHADAAVPIVMVVWPSSWILLPIVIGIEAIVASRLFHSGWKNALKVSGISNIVSSLVGVPLFWFMSYGSWRHFASARAFDTQLWKVTLPLGAAYPTEPLWVITAAIVLLCIPCFFASVWIEYLVANRLTKNEHPVLTKRWAWKANLLTYAPIIIALIVIMAEFLA